MAERLTLARLLAATETEVALPITSERLGTPVTIKVRRISSPEHRAFLPALPPESETWGTTEWLDRQRAWLATLSADELDERRALYAMVAARIVAAAALDPVLTVDEARRLGDEADTVAVEILRFSGLVQNAPQEALDASRIDPVPGAETLTLPGLDAWQDGAANPVDVTA
jgi:hypothetical protein